MPKTLLRTLLIAGGTVLVSGCQASFFGGINLFASNDGILVERDIVFAPEFDLELDVYRPDRVNVDAPVVVFVYGGSWRNGERSWVAFVGRALAKRGAIVVIPDYRKAPDVAYPAFVEDGAKAVAWARAHSARLGGRPERLHVMGHSAGAHIAAMIAIDARFLAREGMAPRDLAGLIGLAGPYDFLPITGDKLREVFGPTHDHPASQPVNFVDGDEPPALLLHGADDRVVWPRNSERLAARLRLKGIAAESRLYPGVGHSGILLALASRTRIGAPVLDDVARFLELDTSWSE
jgi:acetyl esterase/lipase